MSSSDKSENYENGPLRHDGRVPSAQESLTLLLFPQVVGLFALNQVTTHLQLAGVLVGLFAICLIAAGIVYYNIDSWDETPAKIRDRKIAYSIAATLPILGPIMWIKIRD